MFSNADFASDDLGLLRAARRRCGVVLLTFGRVAKRTTHLTVKVAERPLKIKAVTKEPGAVRRSAAGSARKKAAPRARAKKAGV